MNNQENNGMGGAIEISEFISSQNSGDRKFTPRFEVLEPENDDRKFCTIKINREMSNRLRALITAHSTDEDKELHALKFQINNFFGRKTIKRQKTDNFNDAANSSIQTREIGRAHV